MCGESFRVVIDLENAALRRFVSVQFDQFRINFFEILGHVMTQNPVSLRIDANDKVLGCDRLVAAEHAQHFSHIADSDVVWIRFEGVVQKLCRLIRTARLHVEHAERCLRLRQLWHDSNGVLIEFFSHCVLAF